MNRSVADIGGLLIVSQFTLYGVLEKGTRPSFSTALPPVGGGAAVPGFHGPVACGHDVAGRRRPVLQRGWTWNW